MGVFKRGSDGFGEGLSVLSEDLKVSGRCPELAGNGPATAPLAPAEPGHISSKPPSPIHAGHGSRTSRRFTLDKKGN